MSRNPRNNRNRPNNRNTPSVDALPSFVNLSVVNKATVSPQKDPLVKKNSAHDLSVSADEIQRMYTQITQFNRSPDSQMLAGIVMRALASCVESDDIENSFESLTAQGMATWSSQDLNGVTHDQLLMRRRVFEHSVSTTTGLGVKAVVKQKGSNLYGTADVPTGSFFVLNTIPGSSFALSMLKPKTPLPKKYAQSMLVTQLNMSEEIERAREELYGIVATTNALERKLDSVQQESIESFYDPTVFLKTSDTILLFGNVSNTVIPSRKKFVKNMDRLFDRAKDVSTDNDIDKKLSKQQREVFGIHLDLLLNMFIDHLKFASTSIDEQLKEELEEFFAENLPGGSDTIKNETIDTMKETKLDPQTAKESMQLVDQYWTLLKHLFSRRPRSEEDVSEPSGYLSIFPGEDQAAMKYNSYTEDDVRELISAYKFEKEQFELTGAGYRYGGVRDNPKLALKSCYLDCVVKIALSNAACGNWFGTSAMCFYTLVACNHRYLAASSQEKMQTLQKTSTLEGFNDSYASTLQRVGFGDVSKSDLLQAMQEMQEKVVSNTDESNADQTGAGGQASLSAEAMTALTMPSQGAASISGVTFDPSSQMQEEEEQTSVTPPSSSSSSSSRPTVVDDSVALVTPNQDDRVACSAQQRDRIAELERRLANQSEQIEVLTELLQDQKDETEAEKVNFAQLQQNFQNLQNSMAESDELQLQINQAHEQNRQNLGTTETLEQQAQQQSQAAAALQNTFAEMRESMRNAQKEQQRRDKLQYQLQLVRKEIDKVKEQLEASESASRELRKTFVAQATEELNAIAVSATASGKDGKAVICQKFHVLFGTDAVLLALSSATIAATYMNLGDPISAIAIPFVHTAVAAMVYYVAASHPQGAAVQGFVGPAFALAQMWGMGTFPEYMTQYITVATQIVTYALGGLTEFRKDPLQNLMMFGVIIKQYTANLFTFAGAVTKVLGAAVTAKTFYKDLVPLQLRDMMSMSLHIAQELVAKVTVKIVSLSAHVGIKLFSTLTGLACSVVRAFGMRELLASGLTLMTVYEVTDVFQREVHYELMKTTFETHGVAKLLTAKNFVVGASLITLAAVFVSLWKYKRRKRKEYEAEPRVIVRKRNLALFQEANAPNEEEQARLKKQRDQLKGNEDKLLKDLDLREDEDDDTGKEAALPGASTTQTGPSPSALVPAPAPAPPPPPKPPRPWWRIFGKYAALPPGHEAFDTYYEVFEGDPLYETLKNYYEVPVFLLELYMQDAKSLASDQRWMES